MISEGQGAQPNRCRRRAALISIGASVALAATSEQPVIFAQAKSRFPMTGARRGDFVAFDNLMTTFLQEHAIPGAALAVSRAGKLVYSRGFGYSSIENQEPVQPDALFRIASISKSLTGVAVLQLAEKGLLTLDDRVLDRMKLNPVPEASSIVDPRWKAVTIRQCLQHTGGWDRALSFDPIGQPERVAAALSVEFPVTPEHVVRFMLGQPLDFAPGDRYAYSNFGYLVLGRIIEAIAGTTYETYVRKEVLKPLGITTAKLGRALADHRAESEVLYYDRNRRTGTSVYPPSRGEQVPVQYGAENLEAFEAHGGWIASAPDLVRFASSFDNPKTCRILKPASIQQMWTRPAGAAGFEANGDPRSFYYGCGWMVRPTGPDGSLNTWHSGFIAASESLLVRRSDGFNWAVLFNTSQTADGKSLTELIDGKLHEAADRVKSRRA